MASLTLERTKTPGVYRRGSRYVVTFRDHAGRQRKRFAATYAEGKRVKVALATDVARGEYRSVSKVTFAEYAPLWIASYRGRTKRGIGPVTLTAYRRELGLDEDGQPTGDGAVAFFGRMLLTEIGVPELRAFADHVEGRGVARNTVRLALAPVKTLLATAHEDGLIRSNPAAGVRNLLRADQDREDDQAKALTEAELAAVFVELPDAWRPFVAFLAESGLRIGEAIELRWRDVDLGGQWLAVDRRFYRGEVGLPKGRKTRRVRLSERLARDLWALRKQTKAADDELVWTSERGQRVDQSNLMSRVLKPAAVEAGLGTWIATKRGRRAETWVGFHTFRHTCATVLFRSGWNAAQVCRQLGHSDPGFTLRRYVHLLDTDLPEPTVLAAADAAAVGNARATRQAETGRDDEAAERAEIAV
jgi:integrase